MTHSSYVIIDTPGQIEIFTWSASGAIITDAVASALPTVVAYIVDTPRTVAPATFMSNMLYACRYVTFWSLPFSLREPGLVVTLCVLFPMQRLVPPWILSLVANRAGAPSLHTLLPCLERG